MQAVLEDPATAVRTGPGSWLPARAPEPALVAEGLFPDNLTADELGCLLLNRALEGNIPQVKKLVKRLEKMGMTVDQALWYTGDRWNIDQGPLHMAAAYGEVKMCEFLIEKLNLNTNAPDLYGGTPLMYAVKGMESIDVVKLLLSREACPNKMNCRRFTALHIATNRGNYEIAKLLLSEAAVVDPMADDGVTPLHMAAEDGNERIVKLLLDNFPNCNGLMRNSRTPLAMATLGPSLECVNLLIQDGADVNKQVTPLILAAANGKADCVECLLDAGADANIPDENGEVPIIAAAKEGYVDCVEILFPRTTPLDEVEDWSVDGIIHCALNLRKYIKDVVSREELGRVLKAQGDAYLRRREYAKASCLYTMINRNATDNDSDVYAKRCLCWLNMRDKKKALDDANIHKNMKPGSSQSRYLEGAALLLAKEHDRALGTFLSGLNLDFGCELF